MVFECRHSAQVPESSNGLQQQGLPSNQDQGQGEHSNPFHVQAHMTAQRAARSVTCLGLFIDLRSDVDTAFEVVFCTSGNDSPDAMASLVCKDQ